MYKSQEIQRNTIATLKSATSRESMWSAADLKISWSLEQGEMPHRQSNKIQ
jgi:hypothetical protein